MLVAVPHAVEGHVTRGFEAVREAFTENFAQRGGRRLLRVPPRREGRRPGAVSETRGRASSGTRTPWSSSTRSARAWPLGLSRSLTLGDGSTMKNGYERTGRSSRSTVRNASPSASCWGRLDLIYQAARGGPELARGHDGPPGPLKRLFVFPGSCAAHDERMTNGGLRR